jgi:N utilization substance protein B
LKVRREARITALQALYEVDCTGHDPELVLEQRLAEGTLPQRGADFARRLVGDVLRHRPVLDDFIHRHAPEWPFEQMAHIDRNILRMAVLEFAVDGGTPVKVAINEAVELAKTFGSDSAPRFVNGVLGTLVDHKEAIAQAARDMRSREE